VAPASYGKYLHETITMTNLGGMRIMPSLAMMQNSSLFQEYSFCNKLCVYSNEYSSHHSPSNCVQLINLDGVVGDAAHAND